MPTKLKATLYALTAVLLWGCAPIGTRDLVGTNHDALPALPFIGLRYLIAMAFFLPVMPGVLRRWTHHDWLMGALCGFVGVTGYNLPAAIANRTVSAGLTGLIVAVEPLFIVLLLSLRAWKLPGKWTFAAAVIGMTGIALLAHGAGPAQGDLRGVLLLLFGAFNWSCYCVLLPPLLATRGMLQTTAVTTFFGSIPMAVLGAGQMPHLMAVMTLSQWEVMTALSLGTSVIAMVAWNAGSALLGAEASGWFLYMVPVVATAGGAIILAEPIAAIELLGGALIIMSVLVAQIF